jgi:hypothetical protein
MPIKGKRMEDGVSTAGGIKMEDGSEMEFESEVELHGTTSKEHGIENTETRANEHAMEALEKAEMHIDTDGDDDSTSLVIDSAAKVKTEDDFKGFVRHHAKSDEKLKSVDVKDGKVEVEYEEGAKWFGFIGTTIPAHVSANASGTVAVSYPWYHIFMKKEHSSASLESDVARAIAAERKGEKEGIASTTMQATISSAIGIPNLFEIIANTLRGKSSE